MHRLDFGPTVWQTTLEFFCFQTQILQEKLLYPEIAETFLGIWWVGWVADWLGVESVNIRLFVPHCARGSPPPVLKPIHFTAEVSSCKNLISLYYLPMNQRRAPQKDQMGKFDTNLLMANDFHFIE